MAFSRRKSKHIRYSPVAFFTMITGLHQALVDVDRPLGGAFRTQ
ncbi:GSCOCG00011652001-RA-CDS [Cotesia congregata]|nr:GSCOCG00011652001-RA-CDS [Cotesia congregata]